jgi:serine/threonine-protein kinase
VKTFGEGRYEVLEELASSRLGDVFAVRARATGTRFALKTFSPKLGESELERFRREAAAMAALEHPNVVRCFDFGIEPDGTAFLVMDLADGRTLERIAEAGPLEAARAARLGAQIASALDAAHASGIVHRDVQPSNVVVVRGYDGGEMAMLVDFGVASIEASGEYQRLTRAGELLGTPAYSAPEQLRGEAASPASDVYGLGATLYRALAGAPPYSGTTAARVLRAVLKGKRTPLLERRPELGELAAIVERAMALNPRDRQATAAELGRELARVAGQEAKAAPAKASPPRSSARSVMNVWVAVTTILSVGAAAVILYTARSTEPSPATIEPSPLTPVRPAPVEVGDAGATRDAGTIHDAGADAGERALAPTAMAEIPARAPDAGPPPTRGYRVRFGGSTPRVNTEGANAVARIASALEGCARPLPVGSRVWVDVTTIHRCVATARAGGPGLTSAQQVCFDRAIQPALPGCGLGFQWVPEPASFRLLYVIESD